MSWNFSRTVRTSDEVDGVIGSYLDAEPEATAEERDQILAGGRIAKEIIDSGVLGSVDSASVALSGSATPRENAMLVVSIASSKPRVA